MTRRQFAGGLAAALPVSLLAKFDRPLGVQLYTVRSLLPNQGEATLRAIAAIGYKEVEISLPDAAKFAAVLKETGLRPHRLAYRWHHVIPQRPEVGHIHQ